MLFKHSLMQQVALFFFAHQDDEFGVFQHILLAREAGQRVFCVYLTSGVRNGESAIKRNEESVHVLSKLGVVKDDIFFTGTALNIPDGHLAQNLGRAINWILGWINNLSYVSEIFVPAWEGGHPDHDALHAAVVIVANSVGLYPLVRQFPLYNGYRSRGAMFRVLKPIPLNGQPNEVRINYSRRFQFIKYCLSYPSQASSWVGLLPFLILHYLVKGTESTQAVSLPRLHERPHGGVLYYERRGFSTYAEVNAVVEAAFASRLSMPKDNNS